MTPPQSLVLLLSATAMVVATCLSQAHAQVFRTTADAVLIDVSVRQNGAFVRGLTRDDFILLDNGERQKIVAVHDSMMPLQITTIVDASYSITDDIRNSFVRLAESLKSLATVDDIFDMVRLDGTVRRVRSATEVFTPSDAQARTGLLDGLAVVLLDPPKPGYRRLIVMLTDGADTSSLLTSNVVAAIAQRADTVLHIVAVKDPRVPRPWAGREWHYGMLEHMTAPSGGKFYEISVDSDLKPVAGEIVEEMRQRYLLHYTPTTITVPGWHDVAVQLMRSGRYTINARKGYHVRSRQSP